MKISTFEQGIAQGRAFVSARFEWEDSDRPVKTIVIRTDAAFAAELDADPNAFLVAGYLPALRHGERRLRIDGAVCPSLAGGLARAARVLAFWGGRPGRDLAIEPASGFRAPRARPGAGDGGLLSGGIDSSHLFLSHASDFPEGHPLSLASAFYMEGTDFAEEAESPAAAAYSARVRQRLEAMLAGTATRLVPVWTNVRALDPDTDFYARELLSASFVAGILALSSRISHLKIASGADAAHLGRWGSHPLIDPCFSTGALRVSHVGLRFSRGEKIARLSAWPAAVENLVVCNYRPVEPWVNCGVCEKCVATMLELTAFGLMGENRSFPFPEVLPERIDRIRDVIGVGHVWRNIRAALARAGRDDLTPSIDALLRRTARRNLARRILRPFRP